MGLKRTDSCLQNVGDDEPIFVLRAKDKLAPEAVRAWAMVATANGVAPAKVDEAYDLAHRMEQWQQVNGSKVPD